MAGSLPYDDKRGCPPGFIKRKSYTSRAGRRVAPRCIRSQSGLSETRKNYIRRTLAKQTARLKTVGKSATRKAKCPPGEIERRGYVRKFATTIRKKGYTVKRKSGKVYRIYPEVASVYVKPGCVKDRGLPGKLAPGEGFGPLKKGDLKKYGYVYTADSDKRRAALRKAIGEFGALGVYRRLDAVAKLSKRTVPKASDVFSTDRNWVKNNFSLKAF